MKKNNNINLAISIISSLALVWIFLRALVFPVENMDFALNVGGFIFFIEIWTLVIFATFLFELSNYKKLRNVDKIFVFLLILTLHSIVLVGMGFYIYYVIGGFMLYFVFLFSLINKFISHLWGDFKINIKKHVLRPVVVFIVLLFFVLVTNMFWDNLFPYDELYKLRPEALNTSRDISLQGIYVVMIFYFTIMEIYNIKDYLNKK